jgi:hypothetical protein
LSELKGSSRHLHSSLEKLDSKGSWWIEINESPISLLFASLFFFLIFFYYDFSCFSSWVIAYLLSDYSDKSVIVLSTKVYVIGFMLEVFSCNCLFLFSLVVTF